MTPASMLIALRPFLSSPIGIGMTVFLSKADQQSAERKPKLSK
jgi:hypothetical protein